MQSSIPVITIDGPAAVGKGTISQLLASELNFNYLDSGRLYRLLGLWLINHKNDFDLQQAFSESFPADSDITQLVKSTKIDTEEVAQAASKVALMPEVREKLKPIQRSFQMGNGLVADGRDMGTIIFPDAYLKIFLTAADEVRIARVKQRALDKGIDNSKISNLVAEYIQRNQRDNLRKVAPIIPATDSIEINTDNLGISQVVSKIITLYQNKLTKN